MEKKKIELNLNLDYKFTYPEGEEVPTKEKLEQANAELTKNYIEFAVSACHREGLASQFRRLYLGIEKKVDEALKNKTYKVELLQSEFDFINNAFASDKAKFQPAISKYVVVLEDELMKIGSVPIDVV